MKQGKLLAITNCSVKGTKYKKGDQIKTDAKTANYLVEFGFAAYEEKENKKGTSLPSYVEGGFTGNGAE